MNDGSLEPPPTERPPEKGSTERTGHVLVVDDQGIVRDFLAEVLRLQGHRVTVAPDGAAAIETARRDAPQVLLTDLKMEGMHGDELIRRVKEVAPSVVVVVLTGFGTVERTVDLMRRGAFDVLVKPCPAGEIVATVSKAMEHHAALQGNADLRERLRVQEKLAMIGKLAAGVAHELNNPLDATLRCVRLAKDRCAKDGEALELLDLANAGLLRMADIVKSLLAFSRQAAVEQAPESLGRLSEEAATSVTMALGDEAPSVEVDLEPDTQGLRVPRGLHQVLVNLIRNAADATGKKGRVRVRSGRDGDDLKLRVEDDGPGMAPAVLQRIFEPFFTTKPPGKGTGLGLPISARIVEKFGGAISVDCPPSGGTVVSITLPMGRSAVPAA
jgi:signal transduction histidine kinase